MATRTYFAAASLAAAALLAPGAAHALNATSPVQSAVTISSTGTNIGFQGFSNAFKTSKGIPLSAVLDRVLITAQGTSGGSVQVTQYSPAGPAIVTSPGTMNLTVNGVMPLGQSNASSPSPKTIPAAVTSPNYVPGVGTVTITPTVHTYSWYLTPGGTNSLAYFYNNSLTLQAVAEFAPTIGGTAGASESLDSSTFALSSTLSRTYLTFEYTVPPPSAATPGPLPILGAASAFGFSRRLRNNIKKFA